MLLTFLLMGRGSLHMLQIVSLCRGSQKSSGERGSEIPSPHSSWFSYQSYSQSFRHLIWTVVEDDGGSEIGSDAMG